MASPNGADAPLADGGLRPPPDIILPPLAVRDRVEKTTEWLYRRGPQMEEQLIQRSGKDPKFSFLNAGDSYNPYYKWHLEQRRRGTINAAGQAAQPARDTKPKGPPAPPPFRFSARMPNISAKDLEVVKLTALYAAKNGQGWARALSQREAGNYQFDFLRPQHSFHQYFRSLIDQYRILLEEEETVEARIAALQKNVEDKFHLLDRAKLRAEYYKHKEQQREKEQAKVQDEQKEYASIDWHDFSIIAVIDFTPEDDAADLPEPSRLNDLQSASLEQKAMTSLSADRMIDEAAPDQETYYNVTARHPAPVAPPVAPPVQAAYPPAYAPPPGVSVAYGAPGQAVQNADQGDAQEQQERDRAAAKGPSNIKIRTDYVPRAPIKNKVIMQICPNCKQQIPADELSEHMRIELLDPQWKQQRERMDQRYSHTDIASVNVAENLKRLASMRDDVFDGATGLPVSEEELARRKRAALSYDGHMDPSRDAQRVSQMQGMNLQEQLRAIREKHGSTAK